jgi:N-acetylglucosamine kinase-like BadF-type ATPase
MAYVIGIDAGGTKTVGLLADETGRVLTKARGGGANLLVHGELAVEKVLYQILEDLEPPEPVAALCLGIAGVDRPGQKELVLALLRRLGLRRSVQVVHDAVIALVAGAPEGVGIVVVGGTGSIAYGADPEGLTARSGGWGYLLGDEGSAFWLGHAALRLGIRAADGRGPATTLYQRICQRLELQGASELVSWFYDQEKSRGRVTQLASLVEEAAEDGDEAAEELLDHGAGHLARAARAVYRRLHFSRGFPLILAGGVFKACPSLVRRFHHQLELPLAQVTPLEAEPATGAVRMALEVRKS